MSSLALGRQTFLSALRQKPYFQRYKPIHLLGCSLPQELLAYRHPAYDSIRSVDTSNPVVHGLKGIRYRDEFGLPYKESEKLCDLILAVPEQEEMYSILYNIRQFRKMCNS